MKPSMFVDRHGVVYDKLKDVAFVYNSLGAEEDTSSLAFNIVRAIRVGLGRSGTTLMSVRYIATTTVKLPAGTAGNANPIPPQSR